jgi:uncharacterized protein YegP (UPF0339 family)
MAVDRITKYIVQRNQAGRWFWHEIAGNGEVVGTSGQSFASKADAIRACANAKLRAAEAPVEVRDPNAAMTELIRQLAAARVVQRKQPSVLDYMFLGQMQAQRR